MLIDKINDKQLKKPLDVTVTKEYVAVCEDLELYGEGDTEEAAIEDLKEIFFDMYGAFTGSELEGCEEQEKKYLEYM